MYKQCKLYKQELFESYAHDILLKTVLTLDNFIVVNGQKKKKKIMMKNKFKFGKWYQ